MSNFDCKIIKGKWYKNEYKIIKPIGKGGIGSIFLAVHQKRGRVAIKLSKSMLSITREYDTIKKYKGKHFFPAVYELDDWQHSGETYYFFVMEYINGYNMAKLMKKPMPLKLKIKIFMIILKLIADINEEGLIYSDIKLENIMVDYNNQYIRFVDFGSLVPIGESIKEYTPLYDRYNWGLGPRTADLSYQVFSTAVLLIVMLTDLIPKGQEYNETSIIKMLEKHNIPNSLSKLIRKALYGGIKDCREFLEKLKDVDLNKSNRLVRINVNMLMDIAIGFLIIVLGVMLIKIWRVGLI